jgi:hypothetical protein
MIVLISLTLVNVKRETSFQFQCPHATSVEDPDPNVKLNCIFVQKFQYTVKISKIMTPMVLKGKIKQYKIIFQKIYDFLDICKTWRRIRIRIGIKIKDADPQQCFQLLCFRGL